MLGMSIIALLFSLVALFCSIYVDRKAKKYWEEYMKVKQQLSADNLIDLDVFLTNLKTIDFLKGEQQKNRYLNGFEQYLSDLRERQE